jgi:hypothetical protein
MTLERSARHFTATPESLEAEPVSEWLKARDQVWLAGAAGAIGMSMTYAKAVRDAADLADLLRMNRLPEAWMAPPPTRGLRELVRYRAKI